MRRTLSKVTGFIILSLLATTLMIGVMIQTGPVKRKIVGHFLERVYALTGQEVAVSHVTLIPPFQFEAQHVSIRDENGTWLEVERMSISWAPIKLLWNKLSIQDLRLHNVRLLRAPSAPQKSAPPSDESWEMAEDPMAMEIQGYHISQCEIRCLPDDRTMRPFDLHGHLQAVPTEQKFEATVQVTDSTLFGGATHLRVEGAHQDELYVIETHLSESAAGPLSTALQLPGFPTGDVRVRAQGQWERWIALADPQDSAVVPSISGSFEVKSIGAFAVAPQAELFFGQEMVTQGSFTLFSDHSLHVDRIRGRNSKLEYIGWLRFQKGLQLREADLDARLFDLVPLEDYLNIQLAGSLDARLRYRGMPQAREIAVQLASDHLKVEGFNVTGFNGNLVAQHPIARSATALFLLDFKFEDIPVQISSDLHLAAPHIIRCQGVQIDLGPTQLRGGLTLDLKQIALEGQLTGEQQNLHQWSDYAKRRLEGDLDIELTFLPELTSEGKLGQSLALNLTASELATRELKAPDLAVDCQLYDIFQQPHGSLSMISNDIKGNSWFINGVSFDCENSPEGLWTYDLSTYGRRSEPFELETSGEVRVIPNQLQLTINEFHGEIYRHKFLLRSPTELTLNRIQVLLTPLLMEIDEGEVLASIEDAVDGMAASISMRDIPMDILNALRPTTPVSGTFTGNARLHGTRENPMGEILMQLHNFRLQEAGFQHLNPVNANLELQLENQSMDVQLGVTGLDKQPVDIHGHLPIALALDPMHFIASPTDPAIDLHVNAHGELGGFLNLFIPDSNRLSGDYGIALHLLGTLDRPEVHGTIELNDGIYHSLHAGSSFTNIHALFEGEGPRLVLKSLNAEDGRHGRLNATGNVSLRASEFYQFTLTTNIHDCLLVNRHNVQAVFDGRVTLEGNTLEGLLGGKLNVHSADLSIPEEMSTSVPKIDVSYINQPAYEPLPSLFAPVADRWVLHLNLNVKGRDHTFVRGRGLMSEWEGEGRIRGTTADPLLYGKLGLVRGEFNFIGRIFTLTHGDITFNGPPRKSTNLNVTAELGMDGLTAEAYLTGALSEPQLILRSNPSRPLREILSMILFEKEVGEISPLQGLELAQTLLSLTNKGKAPDVVGNIRRTIGLDRLDISHNSDDPNQVAIHAGKYIAEGVFVSVNKAVNSMNNEISIEMRLSDHVKLEGQVGDEVGSRVSLKWKKDY